MSASFEKHYPSVLSVLAAGLLLLALLSPLLQGWRQTILEGCAILSPAALNISAIAVGFLATAQSILLSLNETKIVRSMQSTGHYERLLTFLRSATSNSFAWALVSAGLSTFHLAKGGLWRILAVCFWAYFSCCSILCYQRATSILSAVMREATGASQPESKPWIPKGSEFGDPSLPSDSVE